VLAGIAEAVVDRRHGLEVGDRISDEVHELHVAQALPVEGS
jgi:hypothetical protein